MLSLWVHSSSICVIEIRGRNTGCAGRGTVKDEQARFLFPLNHYHRPPFPSTGCFSLAHDFAHLHSHSPLNLLCEQRIHASTLFRFNTVAALHSPQHIVQREYALLCAFLRSVLVAFCITPHGVMPLFPRRAALAF